MQVSDRIGRRVKLHDLHVLMAVAQAGSMSKAATLLNTTQPAVSKSVADLEHAMGVRLLDRNAHGVEPTQYGQALLRHCSAVFDELKQSVQEIEFIADPTAGEVRIGSTEPLAAGILPAVIDQLNRQYPRISYHVAVQADFSALERELRDRQIDLMIGRPLQPVSDDLDSEILFTDRLLFVAGSKHPLARRRKVALTDLVGENWTLPPHDSAPRSVVAEAFRVAGIEPPKEVVAGFPIPLHASLLATGRFIAVLPESLLHFSADIAVKVLPVDVNMQLRPVVVATLKNRTHSPATELFIDCARAVSKPLVSRK
jgi:DNA-binding transcriptional LysR family regulator